MNYIKLSKEIDEKIAQLYVDGASINSLCPIKSWETVHHIDGDKTNNDIENLQLRIGQHGNGQAYECADCGSMRINPRKLED